MAQHLAKIFGTEEDKVNCPFYLKMGACRHGDRCSRIHNRPILSQTVLLQNMVCSLPCTALAHIDAAYCISIPPLSLTRSLSLCLTLT